MNSKTFNLLKYRGGQSSLYTGRPQGESTREELALNKLDKENSNVVIIIPEGTSSINPSFFLGLFFESIKTLGVEEFREKYQFQVEERDLEIKEILLENIEDGIRHAQNTLMGTSGLKRFIKKK